MNQVTRKQLWSGRVLSGLAVAFLLFDGVTHALRMEAVVQWTVQLGYPPGAVPVIGALLLAGLVLYVIPWTALYGSIWLTGYLGGAVATHVRIGSPLFSHTLFPCYVAALLWVGLALRHPRLRALLWTRD
ncbi:MAG: DoxX family protein [Candidatus Lambdaproteobacteria bacterium]|nr:DoxX family protein [Candidatus Lambdaproteobacteria bacterium]